MAKSLTVVMGCPGTGFISCSAMGYAEYGGLCPGCWLKCTDEQRSALFPQYVGPRVIEVTTRVTEVHNPPVPWLLTLGIGCAGGMLGFMAEVVFRRWLGW
jgi:hypothetical protein